MFGRKQIDSGDELKFVKVEGTNPPPGYVDVRVEGGTDQTFRIPTSTGFKELDEAARAYLSEHS